MPTPDTKDPLAMAANIALLIIALLALVGVAADRFGVDSREGFSRQ